MNWMGGKYGGRLASTVVRAMLLCSVWVGLNLAQASFNSGLNAYARGEHSVAFAAWQALAEAGHGLSQYNLGVLYEKGHGTVKDERAAYHWYWEAAQQGIRAAQYSLGMFYEQGRGGVLQNLEQAAAWYRQAAQRGYVPAQTSLGMLYAAGQGVARSTATALSWFRRAAAQGDARAQNSLGVAYQHGVGVRASLKLARYWYTKAAQQGDPEALRNLQLLEHPQLLLPDAAAAAPPPPLPNYRFGEELPVPKTKPLVNIGGTANPYQRGPVSPLDSFNAAPRSSDSSDQEETLETSPETAPEAPPKTPPPLRSEDTATESVVKKQRVPGPLPVPFGED